MCVVVGGGGDETFWLRIETKFITTINDVSSMKLANRFLLALVSGVYRLAAALLLIENCGRSGRPVEGIRGSGSLEQRSSWFTTRSRLV
jgi:hypothetical protein